MLNHFKTFLLSCFYKFFPKANYVSDEEMRNILSDKELLEDIQKGIVDIENGDYQLIE